MKKNLWKNVAIFGILFALSLVVTACSGNSTPQGASSAPEASTSVEATAEASSSAEAEASASEVSSSSEEAAPSQASSSEAEQEANSSAQQTSSKPASADAGEITQATLSSGSISIDGDIFVMGKSLNEIPAGWGLKPEDSEKYKDYTLNPMTTSGSAMGVYKESYGYDYESFHVMLSLMNASDSPIAYLDGTIDYLSIPGLSRTEVVAPIVFPGGLTPKSSEADFIAVYGEPTYEYGDEGSEFRSLDFRDGDVKLSLNWYKGVLDEITIQI